MTVDELVREELSYKVRNCWLYEDQNKDVCCIRLVVRGHKDVQQAIKDEECLNHRQLGYSPTIDIVAYDIICSTYDRIVLYIIICAFLNMVIVGIS